MVTRVYYSRYLLASQLPQKGEHVSCLDLRLDLSVQFFFLEAKMEAVSYVRVVAVVVFISSKEKKFLICVTKKTLKSIKKVKNSTLPQLVTKKTIYTRVLKINGLVMTWFVFEILLRLLFLGDADVCDHTQKSTTLLFIWQVFMID